MDDPTPELLERWYAGDEQALSALLNLHGEWLQGFVRRSLGPRLRRLQDSNDVVQDALIEFLRYGPAFVPDSCRQFRAMMGKIVSNRLSDLHDYAGAAKRCREFEAPQLDSRVVSRFGPSERSSLSPSRVAEADEEAARLRLAIELLEPPDQQIIHLHQYQGRAFLEIGEQLGIATKAANKRYQRALMRLGRVVRRLGNGELDELSIEFEEHPTDSDDPIS